MQDYLVTGNASGLAASHYDSAKKTKIYGHGCTMSGYDSTATAMRDAFLGAEDCNFISVNWEKLAGSIYYYASAENTQLVGQLTGDFINFLVAQGTLLTNIHIVGFSKCAGSRIGDSVFSSSKNLHLSIGLGAQVAGNAGAAITSGKVARITGLDPAYPGFSMDDNTTRLDQDDATFVDVIHTNSGTLPQLCLSFPFNIGHVDFWPNGDPPQAQPVRHEILKTIVI